ncbi:hypothetical protein [Streptomyces sp. MMBL 11-3]|uniref:hypothetical protein n=1 Tax=Streptomyces sp. MMBL 11-3 TaxID=3382639 RepID=UPI0039B41241
MDENGTGKLQIFSIEERGGSVAVCVVRCVGGVARVGQRFDVGSAGEVSHVTLDRIHRYGQQVDFVDPPHNAKVHLSGEGVPLLTEGIVIGG